ncbi:hypothetical protein G9C98_007944 [Cotesia typhae]|uniref:C2H2-type domain-containing protein n=1 Tax=Cotesia typhae TaxID=2053667 RepID=A0A8J5R025_9HYME|nr:hypothetical protein G9C98_007944 [Cotesia typhae]
MSSSYVCSECGTTFMSRVALNRHVRKQCGRLLYRCPLCQIIIPMKFNLINHLRAEHKQIA